MTGTGISRRTWWAVTGGAVLSAVSAALVWKNCPRPTQSAGASPAPDGYVDHDGWMLSAEDKQTLAPSPAVEGR